MIDMIALSFGQQLDALSSYMSANWAWPSPDAGFALYVARSAGAELPAGLGDVSLSDTQMRRLDQAPVLAATGYALALSPSSYGPAVQDAWAKGLTRLASRQPFTPDHNSFFYRPTELLGLSLGALHCALVQPAEMAWLRGVVVEGEHRLSSGDLWVQVLAAKSAEALSHPWKQIAIRSIEAIDIADVALLAWLYGANDALAATFRPSIDGRDIDRELLMRCATSELSPQGTAHAAILYYALRVVVRRAVATFSDRDQDSPTIGGGLVERHGLDLNNDFITGAPGSKEVLPAQTANPLSPDRDPRKVFVVHGRNDKARNALFIFLRAIGLQPTEWSQAIDDTGKGTPYIGEVLDIAFSTAQAIVVLFTPDDEARLREAFRQPYDPSYETQLTPQARPNVLFEAGMAMGRDSDRTVLVELGELRQFSDIAGRHVVRLTDSMGKRQELAQRLKRTQCDVNLIGTDWHTAGDFEGALN